MSSSLLFSGNGCGYGFTIGRTAGDDTTFNIEASEAERYRSSSEADNFKTFNGYLEEVNEGRAARDFIRLWFRITDEN